jgi:hypothetical protein
MAAQTASVKGGEQQGDTSYIPVIFLQLKVILAKPDKPLVLHFAEFY